MYIYIHTYSKYSRQPVVSAVAVGAFCLFGSDLLSPQAQGLLNQNAMLTWPNVQYHNCCTRKGALSLTRPLSLLNPLFIRLIQKSAIHMLNWNVLICCKACCINVANHLCTNWWHVVSFASAISRRCWWLQTSYWIRGCVGLSHVGVPVALIFIIFHLSLHATVGAVAPGVDLCHILIVVRAVAAPACYLSLLRVPHTLELGSSPLLSPDAQFVVEPVSSFLLLQSLSVCCWGSPSVLGSSPLLSPVGFLPKCSLLLFVCWSSPGCCLDHCSATMKRLFKAACCVCCCSARLLSVGLGPVVTPGSRQGLLNQNAMLTRLNFQYHNCGTRKGALSLTHIYIYIYRYLDL